MSEAAFSPEPSGRSLVLAGLRGLWFVLVPALLSALVLRYLLPSPVRAPDGALRELCEWAEPRKPLLALAFFLLFSVLVRYWRSVLPGAELWAQARPLPAKPRGAAGTLVSVGFVALAVLSALVLRGSFFQSYRVLSGSMLPTLQPGEVLLSKQYAYGAHLPGLSASAPRAPRRGDIVVFHRPPVRPDVPEELVKRVIGLPGDTISTYAGFASINGWQIPTCLVGPYVYISGDSMLEAQLRMEYLEDRVYLTAHVPAAPEASEPYTVRPGEVFVLGDNRNNSSDSRAWNDGHGGGLRFDEISGKAERFLFGAHRSGSSDFSKLLQPIGTDVRIEGVDDRDLRDGVARCLKQRPKSTTPPRPQGVTP